MMTVIALDASACVGLVGKKKKPNQTERQKGQATPSAIQDFFPKRLFAKRLNFLKMEKGPVSKATIREKR